MIQRFIELGEGYGDLYELIEIAKSNQGRIHHAYIFQAPYQESVRLSFAVALKPADNIPFIPIYVCREGIEQKEQMSGREQAFRQAMADLDVTPIQLNVKHSSEFGSTVHHYQALIAILRLNHLLPPLS